MTCVLSFLRTVFLPPSASKSCLLPACSKARGFVSHRPLCHMAPPSVPPLSHLLPLVFGVSTPCPVLIGAAPVAPRRSSHVPVLSLGIGGCLRYCRPLLKWDSCSLMARCAILLLANKQKPLSAGQRHDCKAVDGGGVEEPAPHAVLLPNRDRQKAAIGGEFHCVQPAGKRKSVQRRQRVLD